MKKFITLLLALAMVFSVVACAKNDKKTAGTTGPNNNGTNGEPGSHIPELDFDNATFRFHERSTGEIFVDEESTDIVDNAVWIRNETVEDRLGVVFERVAASGTFGVQAGEIVSLALGEIDFCEVALPYVMACAPFITSGIVQNWKNLKYTDLSQPYWMNDINDKFAIKENIYAVVGEFALSTITEAYAVFYNRTKGEIRDPQLSATIFKTIQDGDWTYDYFHKLISNIYDDIDTVIGRSADDFYGLVMDRSSGLDTYHFSWDIPCIENDPDKGLHIDNYLNDKLISAIAKVDDLYHATEGTYHDPNNHSFPRAHFVQGKSLFCMAILSQAFSTFRTMEDDYTILPFPKYDDNQEDYLTGLWDGYTVMVIPSTTNKLDMISAVVEVMNLESWKSVYPVARDDALKGKYARDPETIEMVDIILKGRNFDIAYLISRDIRLSYLFGDIIQGVYPDISSAFDGLKDGYNQALQYIMDRYEIWAE